MHEVHFAVVSIKVSELDLSGQKSSTRLHRAGKDFVSNYLLIQFTKSN